MGKIAILKRIFLKILLGKFYSPNYFAAEKKCYKKIPVLKSKYSFLKRLKCFLGGFNSDKLVWYNFIDYKKEDYISDLVHFRDFEKIDLKYYYIAHNKLVCERFFSPYCNFVPTLAYIEKGVLFDVTNDGTGIGNIKNLEEAVRRGEEFYLKPNDEGSGRGIGRLWVKEGEIYWNHKIIGTNDFYAFVSSLSGYLIQRRFEQKGYFNELNPNTLNTLRVVTMLHPLTQEPFVACATQRLGRVESFVDNIAQNGILCPVHVETGVIEYGVVYPANGILERVTSHPDSKIKIAGVQIPHWEAIVDLCKNLALKVPFMPLCGWDVVVSEEKILIQELNYNPDIYLGQISKPLLLDKKTREFYNYYCKRS